MRVSACAFESADLPANGSNDARLLSAQWRRTVERGVEASETDGTCQMLNSNNQKGALSRAQISFSRAMP